MNDELERICEKIVVFMSLRNFGWVTMQNEILTAWYDKNRTVCDDYNVIGINKSKKKNLTTEIQVDSDK